MLKKIAKLANLQLTVEEEKKYTAQLSKILEYIDQLNKVDTSSVGPTFNVTNFINVMAEDKILPSLPEKNALQNASNIKDGFFVTKGVFSNE